MVNVQPCASTNAAPIRSAFSNSSKVLVNLAILAALLGASGSAIAKQKPQLTQQQRNAEATRKLRVRMEQMRRFQEQQRKLREDEARRRALEHQMRAQKNRNGVGYNGRNFKWSINSGKSPTRRR